MNQLFNGDMLKELDNVDNNSVDLLLTDPPYNISGKGVKPEWNKIDKKTGEKISINTIHDHKFDNTFDEQWDSCTEKEFIKQLEAWSKIWFKKMRKGGSFAIFISDRYISHLWSAMEDAGFEPKRVWTWKKPAAVPFNRKVNPVSGAEYILWGIKPKGKRTFNSDAVKNTIVERYSRADKVSSILYKHIKNDTKSNLNKCFKEALTEAKEVLKGLKHTDDIMHCVIPNTITYSGGLGKSKIHPTQKPTEILEYFITLLSNKKDLVLDTFAGSGSTGLVCKELDRDYILIEKDKKMFKKMKINLLKNHLTASSNLKNNYKINKEI